MASARAQSQFGHLKPPGLFALRLAVNSPIAKVGYFWRVQFAHNWSSVPEDLKRNATSPLQVEHRPIKTERQSQYARGIALLARS